MVDWHGQRGKFGVLNDDFKPVLFSDESNSAMRLSPAFSLRIPALAEIGFRNGHATN